MVRRFCLLTGRWEVRRHGVRASGPSKLLSDLDVVTSLPALLLPLGQDTVDTWLCHQVALYVVVCRPLRRDLRRHYLVVPQLKDRHVFLAQLMLQLLVLALELRNLRLHVRQLPLQIYHMFLRGAPVRFAVFGLYDFRIAELCQNFFKLAVLYIALGQRAAFRLQDRPPPPLLGNL